MFIKSISLQNFRNYQKKTFQFDSQMTLVVGPNTSGKTNLLEAIYLLATGKSFRAEVEAEMIGYGEEVARIGAKVADSSQKGRHAASKDISTENRLSSEHSDEVALEILLTTGSVLSKKVAKKKYLVNGVSRRMIDFVGQLKAVYFGPEDLQLVTDSPSLRRRYLDMVLSQVDREYRRASLSYEKGVRQRNRVLEEIREKHQDYRGEELRRRLYFWDQLLVKNGNYITGKREEFVDFVSACRGKPVGLKILNPTGCRASPKAMPAARGIGEQAGSQFQLEYVKSVISPVALEENFEREIRAGMTLVGPHRDDIRFKVREGQEGQEGKEGRDLSIYGSRGEQRLAVLWLKMGELEYIAQKTGERPTLLLDDIFSELDEKYREMVLGVLARQQTIVTTTEEKMVEENEREKMQIIYFN